MQRNQLAVAPRHPAVGAASYVLAAIILATGIATSACRPSRPPAATESTKGQAERARTPAFDEKRAFSDLQGQVALGPRVPGTAAHIALVARLTRQLRDAGWTVTLQRVEPPGSRPGTPRLTNVVAWLTTPSARRDTGGGSRPRNDERGDPPTGAPWMLVAHYDSRPYSDRERDVERRALPVPGANDGASGVAVLLEAARQIAARPADFAPTVLAFVDGEDWPTRGMPQPSGVALAGSTALARWAARHSVRAALVVDMVGDRDLHLGPEARSAESSTGLVERVWRTGRALSPGVFDGRPIGPVVDDHVPLIAAGIPTCLLIDLQYPAWHTQGDTPDKASAASLGAVGRVVMVLISRR